MIETIVAIVCFGGFSAFFFWLSEKPERMSWMQKPSDPIIQRLVTRGAAWFFFFITGAMLCSLVWSLISG